MGFLYLAILKLATLGGSKEYYVPLLLTDEVDELLQIVGEVIPCSRACTLLLLVIMAKLAEHIIARLHRGKYLIKSVACKERTCRQATLSMVGYGHAIIKPPGYHLSPAGPWLPTLVYYCRVATEKQRYGGIVRLYADTCHGRHLTIELQCKPVVPVKVVTLALLELHAHLVADIW